MVKNELVSTVNCGAAQVAIAVPTHGASSDQVGHHSNNNNTNNSPSKVTGLKAIGTNAPVALHTISSQFASASSTIVFYPFDVLKTRYMSQDGTVVRQHNGQTYSNMFRSLQTIIKQEGTATLFRGCSVAVAGSITAWGLYMLLYRYLCNAAEIESFFGRSGLSIVASMIASFVSSPIFLIKSRMQLEEGTACSKHYRTFRSGLVHTVRSSGLRGLWRGVPLQLILVLPNALGIPMYDHLKGLLLRYRKRRGSLPEGYNLSLFEVCLCSTITKVALLAATHPLVMMKVRIQDQRAHMGPIHYHRIAQTMQVIVKTQGFKGLYRGFNAALIHALPRSLLHYVIYERSLNLLCRYYS